MFERHLIYLHGFRSSPQSAKARRLGDWVARHAPQAGWWCPQLPCAPAEAVALVEARLAALAGVPATLIGSSLGGFYATVLAERHGLPALVLNPAIQPARDLAGYVGRLTAYHDPAQTLDFRAEHLAQLRALAPSAITRPERYAALIAKGDELLDWREMAAFYAGARMRLIDGSDHALSDFDDHLPFVLDCLQLTPRP
jgi:predicted esterase YcpF (UPF0227 family)